MFSRKLFGFIASRNLSKSYVKKVNRVSSMFVHETGSKRTDESSREKLKSLPYSALGVGIAITYIFWEKYKNGLEIQILPSVFAAQPDVSGGRREKYNFIADIVNKVVPSVVYIEIKDNRR